MLTKPTLTTFVGWKATSQKPAAAIKPSPGRVEQVHDGRGVTTPAPVEEPARRGCRGPMSSIDR